MITNGRAGWAAPLLVTGPVLVMESEAGNGGRPGGGEGAPFCHRFQKGSGLTAGANFSQKCSIYCLLISSDGMHHRKTARGRE